MNRKKTINKSDKRKSRKESKLKKSINNQSAFLHYSENSLNSTRKRISHIQDFSIVNMVDGVQSKFNLS